MKGLVESGDWGWDRDRGHRWHEHDHWDEEMGTGTGMTVGRRGSCGEGR